MHDCNLQLLVKESMLGIRRRDFIRTYDKLTFNFFVVPLARITMVKSNGSKGPQEKHIEVVVRCRYVASVEF